MEDNVFHSRQSLFGNLEPGLDFFLAVGDNEWNECIEFDPSSNSDPVKDLWRDLFASPTSAFWDFDRPSNLPSGVSPPTVERQELYPENVFFTYLDVAFFVITEPAGDSLSDANNAAWIHDKLNIFGCGLEAVVMFGHNTFSSEVQTELVSFYGMCGNTPTLYIQGNSHPADYCMEYDSRFAANNVLTLTVEPFKAGPLLVSIVNESGSYFFHVEETAGCA
jgi:hypothetical protein